jgi:uncharacterized protein (DUF1800 family)
VKASRFLAQAAVGHSRADINALTGSSANQWLTAQFAQPRAQTFWDFLSAHGYDAAANVKTEAGFLPMVWSQLMGGADPLRQRVGLALLSQWVVSIHGLTLPWRAFAMAAYLDILWDHAFGNYRDLMEAVSTSAAMGNYLTFLGSVKANPTTGSIPDENYARELMQLFTIGLYQLQMDGTLVLSGGQPVATYSQADVSAGARIWTGYGLANSDNTTPARLRLPLANNAAHHESGATTLLNGSIVVPAGVGAAQARQILLDGLFHHPNVPPFVARQLIQHLVTSNPSPAYVSRVAHVFADNGQGVRGDLQAVIRAVLTDREARDDAAAAVTTQAGKLREPVNRLVQWARAFHVTSPTALWPFGDTTSALGEATGEAPNVFNWFRPGYSPPGTAITMAGLVAPEFQITNEVEMISYVNRLQQIINSGAGEAKADYSALSAIAGDSQALLNELNLVLAANQLSPTVIAALKVALDSISVRTAAGGVDATGITNRIHTAILLVMASPDYLVQR